MISTSKDVGTGVSYIHAESSGLGLKKGVTDSCYQG